LKFGIGDEISPLKTKLQRNENDQPSKNAQIALVRCYVKNQYRNATYAKESKKNGFTKKNEICLRNKKFT